MMRFATHMSSDHKLYLYIYNSARPQRLSIVSLFNSHHDYNHPACYTDYHPSLFTFRSIYQYQATTSTILNFSSIYQYQATTPTILNFSSIYQYQATTSTILNFSSIYQYQTTTPTILSKLAFYTHGIK